jgi:murein DD-endopeptidase MepM/ murein hydrolase activator NlpD
MMEKPQCGPSKKTLLLFMLAAAAVPGRVSAELKEIAPGLRGELSTSEALEGGIVVVTLESDSSLKLDDLTATFDGKETPFYEISDDEEAHRYGAVFGVNHDHKPGKSEVIIHSGSKKGVIPLSVVDGGFASEKLTVSAKHVNPPKKEMKRILKEQKEIGKIYRQLTHEKRWEGAFKLPIDSPITSPFGTKRMYNGEQRNFHPGMDLKAPEGTPIHAPAKGKVVLAKNLYFTGNTVALDHGFGVITLYAHMSKLKVKVGDVVDTGAALGLSGKTGRASGPHLHWQAVIQAVKVNPLELTHVMR